MAKKIQEKAFAAINGPHLMVWTISGSAKLVRKIVGEQWDAEDHRTGWKAARIEGIRLVKVDITAHI